MKKLLSILLLLLCVSSCTVRSEENGKLQVIATLFPQYDFAREIAGDLAEVTLLLPPGAESHAYEPTPTDFVAIERADLLLYTGDAMEPWVAQIASGEKLVNTTEKVEIHAHDPHIWTSPKNACKMVENIADALCNTDPDHAEVYRKNAAEYLIRLQELDASFERVIRTAKRKTVVFGGRNAFYYFGKDYGLTCYSAYDSCGHESEPSASAVAVLIDRVKAESIPVVYHEELTDPKVARVIREATGAELLPLHACHNVTQAELDAGASYLGLMQQNLKHLMKGIN